MSGRKTKNWGRNLAGKCCTDLAWNLATWQEQSGIVEHGRRGTCDRWEQEREGPLLEKQYTKRHSQPRSLLPLVEREKGSNKGLRLDQLGVKSRAIPAGWNWGSGKYQRDGEWEEREREKKQKKHGRKKPEASPWNCLSVGQSQQENTVKEKQRETLQQRNKQSAGLETGFTTLSGCKTEIKHTHNVRNNTSLQKKTA